MAYATTVESVYDKLENYVGLSCICPLFSCGESPRTFLIERLVQVCITSLERPHGPRPLRAFDRAEGPDRRLLMWRMMPGKISQVKIPPPFLIEGIVLSASIMRKKYI